MNHRDPAAYPLEALHLRDGTYAVRPKGQLGTCGWFPYPWQVQYVKASTPASALQRAWEARAEHASAEREFALSNQ